MNSQGQATVPVVLTLSILVAGALAVLGLRFQFRRQVETQRRLDQCIQRTAVSLLSLQKSIEFSNLRITLERAAVQAASGYPAAAVAARAILESEVFLQSKELYRWYFLQGEWLIKNGCDQLGDLPRPLPTLSWVRDPPDDIGSKPLRWNGEKSNPLPLFLMNGKRVSYAEITFKNFQWHADWRDWTKSF